MSKLERGGRILEGAETALRELLAEAAAMAEYGAVVQLADWARTLSELRARNPSTSRRAPQPPPTPNPLLLRPTPATSPRIGSRPASRDKGYPRFHRHGDRVVRVGWSKREKQEYQQQTPFPVFRIIVAAVERAGREGRVFSVEELAPSVENDGEAVPAYQVYGCIALLKQVGMIDQHGRRGYSICQPAQLGTAIEALLANLPES